MSDGSVCVEEQENRSTSRGEGRGGGSDASEAISVFSSQADMSWRNLILQPSSLKKGDLRTSLSFSFFYPPPVGLRLIIFS